MTRLRRSLAAFVLIASVAGCPQERPEAARQIPREHIPPAVSLEPPGGERGRPPPDASAGAHAVDVPAARPTSSP